MNKAPRSPAILIAGSLFLFAFIAVVLFSRAVNYGLSHDEYQFVASGLMFARGLALPYRDCPFLQMPYTPLVNGLLFLVGGNALFLARLLNAVFGLSGLDVYPVFTPGPFAWRTAPILSPEKRQRLWPEEGRIQGVCGCVAPANTLNSGLFHHQPEQ